jgi:hypothetical protein
MALAVDKNSKPYKGIARIITKRKGSVDVLGYIDNSKLVIVKSNDGVQWKKIKELKIKKITKIIKKITKKDRYFIGLEDPDIYRNSKGLIHLYYTIAFKLKSRPGCKVYLGHAKGKSLDSLKATKPKLSPNEREIDGYKEVCIIKNKNKIYALSELLLYTT